MKIEFVNGIAHFIPETEKELVVLTGMSLAGRSASAPTQAKKTHQYPAKRAPMKRSYKKKCPICLKPVKGARGISMHKNWHEGKGHFGNLKKGVDNPVTAPQGA